MTWPASFTFLTGSSTITAGAGQWTMASIYCMTNAGGSADFIVQLIK
jgi:hypothetical protein